MYSLGRNVNELSVQIIVSPTTDEDKTSKIQIQIKNKNMN